MKSKLIKLVLAEDQQLVRLVIKAIIEKEPDMQVVFEANDGSEVLNWINKGHEADIVLTDMDMPGLNGINLIKKLPSTISSVVLSMVDNQKDVLETIGLGAKGYFLKSIGTEEFLFGLRHIAKGGKYICSELSYMLIEDLSSKINFKNKKNEPIQLTARELSVLTLIAHGHTNIEIAEKLFTSKRTVENYRQGLIDKTGVKNAPDLIRFSFQNNLIK